MKRLLAATLALTLLDATAALAQDDHRGGPPRGGEGPHGGGAPQAGTPRGGGGPQGGGQPRGDRAGHDQAPGPAPAFRAGPAPYVPQGHGDRPHPDGMPPQGRPDNHLGRGFGAPGFGRDAADRPRYSPQYFPREVRPAQHYHWSGDHDWRPQPGFYVRHWRYGDTLPDGWFASSFWIYDWGDYDLPVPPYGYEWVRVGPDALLVDTYTGEVVSTVYGLFD